MVNLERLLRDILFPSCPHTLLPDREVNPEADPFPRDIQTLIENTERTQSERAARIRAWLSEYERIQNGRNAHHDPQRAIIFNVPALNVAGTARPRANDLLDGNSSLRFRFYQTASMLDSRSQAEVFLENTPWYFPEGGVSFSGGRINFEGALLWGLLGNFIFDDRLGPQSFNTESVHRWIWWDLFMGRFLDASQHANEENFVQSSALARLGRDFIHDRMTISVPFYEIVDELLAGFGLPRDSAFLSIFGQPQSQASAPGSAIQNLDARFRASVADFFYDPPGPERGAWIYLGATDPFFGGPSTRLEQGIVLDLEHPWQSFRLSGSSHLGWDLFRFPGGLSLRNGSLDISTLSPRDMGFNLTTSLDENSVGEDDLLRSGFVSPGDPSTLSTGMPIPSGIRIHAGGIPGELQVSANLNFGITLKIFGVPLRISGQLLANVHLVFEQGSITVVPHDNTIELHNFQIQGDRGSYIVSHGSISIHDRSTTSAATQNEGIYFDFNASELQAQGFIPLLMGSRPDRYNVAQSLNPFHLDLNTWFETEHPNDSNNGNGNRPNFHFQINSSYSRDQQNCHRSGKVRFTSHEIPFHTFLRKIGVHRPLPPLLLHEGDASMFYDWNLRSNHLHNFSLQATHFDGSWNSLILSVSDWLPRGLGGLRIALGSRSELTRRSLNLNSNFSVRGEADLSRQEFSAVFNLHASGAWFLGTTREPLLRNLDLNMRLNERGAIANLRSLWYTQALNPISSVPPDAPGYSLLIPHLAQPTYFPLDVSNHRFRWGSSGGEIR